MWMWWTLEAATSTVAPWHSVVPEDSTPGRLLRIVASIAPPLLSGARARDLSNLAWAFATLDLRKFDSVGQRDPRKTWGKFMKTHETLRILTPNEMRS
jgi:hypothetical protein